MKPSKLKLCLSPFFLTRSNTDEYNCCILNVKKANCPLRFKWKKLTLLIIHLIMKDSWRKASCLHCFFPLLARNSCFSYIRAI